MVTIRMRRMGANKDVFYRVVAADSSSPRDGRFLETLGWYDPKRSGENYLLKLDRIDYWLSRGARITDTVKSLAGKARRAAAGTGHPAAAGAGPAVAAEA